MAHENNKGFPFFVIEGSVAVENAGQASPDDVRPCGFCRGQTTDQPDGTAYCCDRAELAALRRLIKELDRRVATELEDPPMDTHAACVLSYIHEQIVRRRRSRTPR